MKKREIFLSDYKLSYPVEKIADPQDILFVVIDVRYIYLQECKDSQTNGLYQLILDGQELWYGTLQEINAVVKSMLHIIVRRDLFPSIEIK